MLVRPERRSHLTIIEWQIVHGFPNYSENDATNPLFCNVSWMLKQALRNGFAESRIAVLVFKKWCSYSCSNRHSVSTTCTNTFLIHFLKRVRHLSGWYSKKDNYWRSIPMRRLGPDQRLTSLQAVQGNRGVALLPYAGTRQLLCHLSCPIFVGCGRCWTGVKDS